MMRERGEEAIEKKKHLFPALKGKAASRQSTVLTFLVCKRFLLVIPIHGRYSQWSYWGSCSQRCGRGTQQRSRYCTNPRPKNGGRDCNSLGPGRETRICNSHSCQGKLFKLCFVHIPKPQGIRLCNSL